MLRLWAESSHKNDTPLRFLCRGDLQAKLPSCSVVVVLWIFLWTTTPKRFNFMRRCPLQPQLWLCVWNFCFTTTSCNSKNAKRFLATHDKKYGGYHFWRLESLTKTIWEPAFFNIENHEFWRLSKLVLGFFWWIEAASTVLPWWKKEFFFCMQRAQNWHCNFKLVVITFLFCGKIITFNPKRYSSGLLLLSCIS